MLPSVEFNDADIQAIIIFNRRPSLINQGRSESGLAEGRARVPLLDLVGDVKVARLSAEDLEFCTEQKKCLDCYQKDDDTPAVKWQTRRQFKVPCCHKHFYEHKNKTNEADTKKYARNSAKKVKARMCVYKGCRGKLIPKELLPPWIDERTCGLHCKFKAFRTNRASILRFITEHCLTPEERDGMTAEDVVYRRGDGLVLFKWSQGQTSSTVIFSARDLLESLETSPLIEISNLPCHHLVVRKGSTGLALAVFTNTTCFAFPRPTARWGCGRCIRDIRRVSRKSKPSAKRPRGKLRSRGIVSGISGHSNPSALFAKRATN